MMPPLRRALFAFVLTVLSLALGAQAASARSAQGQAAGSGWGLEGSDIAPDPAFRFGRLENGMRYVVRRNRNPRGTAQIRMDVAAGSLDEREDERGFAHFVEHMAFNGSTHFAEGEMIRTLERHGLANGPDTNAGTGFLSTTYRFDLPRNHAKLIDLSLTLLREIASELTFDPEAVERARGVVLSEMRDRNTWQRRNSMAEAAFRHPDALYPRRFSIGTPETLNAATAASLKAFWRRVYVPAKVTVIVVGDVDPGKVERDIAARFGSWHAGTSLPQPSAGPIDAGTRGRTAVYVEPPISERVLASRHGPWIDGADSRAQEEERLLRKIGYGAINRRFRRVAREPDPPFRAASIETESVFRAGRTTTLAVDTVNRRWRPGLLAAAKEYRRALTFGLSAAEVAEQVEVVRNQMEVAAASAGSRSNSALIDQLFVLLRDGIVPTAPDDALKRFRATVPTITPERVQAAILRDAVPLSDPILRLEGADLPEGGEQAIRDAWNSAMTLPLRPGPPIIEPKFAYTDFGLPGRVVSDSREPSYGIRRLRFANGVMLNLKRTALERQRVRLQVSVDGGEMLNTRDNPTATQLVRLLPVGGLGRHTLDDLQSIRAGHTTDFTIGASPEGFVSSAATAPRDLLLQLQLYAALITDPAYRQEGEVEYRLNINNYFNGLSSSPSSALLAAIGGILSDDDPRFTLQPVTAYRALTFDKLRRDISDRLAHGAIEIGLVGDFDEKQAISAVAATFGALPAREPVFRAYPEQRHRPFTADRSRRIVRHAGPSDQALLRLTWPTRDDSDPEAVLALELLERVVQIELTETLRQNLGKAYSPEAFSMPSRFWNGFGTFSIAVQVGVRELLVSRGAVNEAIAGLRAGLVSEDVFQRALQPLIEAQANSLKSNGGWMSIVARAQSEPDRIDRRRLGMKRLRKLTAADLQALAQRYLDPGRAIEVMVLPEAIEIASLDK